MYQKNLYLTKNLYKYYPSMEKAFYRNPHLLMSMIKHYTYVGHEVFSAYFLHNFLYIYSFFLLLYDTSRQFDTLRKDRE